MTGRIKIYVHNKKQNKTLVSHNLCLLFVMYYQQSAEDASGINLQQLIHN